MKSEQDKFVGSVRFWALGASLAVHLVALSALGAFHFNRRGQTDTSPPSDISIHTLQRVLEEPTPKPKPRLEPPPAPTVQTPDPEPAPSPKPPRENVSVAASTAAEPTDTVMFYGSRTTGRRVCYVVDGSGSMFGLMYLVRQQLRESILNLSGEQAFNVLFFMQNGQLLQPFDGRLTPATPAAKAESLSLIDDIRPEGQTCAERAMAAALSMRDRDGNRPDVIYFLTDGFDLMGGDGDAFVRRIAHLRKQHAPATVVHTIGVYPGPQDGRILSSLANACGGRYIEIN